MADYSGPQYPRFNRRSNLSVPSDVLSQQSPWSDLNRGFALAAQWDPRPGTIIFATPRSMGASSPYPFIHSSNDLDVDGDQSHSDTLDLLSVTGALSPFHQTSDIRSIGSPVASSAEYGPDTFLYTRRSRYPNSRHYSCFDTLDADLSFDATKAFVDLERIILGNRRRNVDAETRPTEDQGMLNGRGNSYHDSDRSTVFVELAVCSTFSTSSTSTSNYVFVPRAFHLDDTPTGMDNDIPEPPRPPDPDIEDKLLKFMRGFRGWKRRREEDDRWVVVDVTQVVTQSYAQL